MAQLPMTPEQVTAKLIETGRAIIPKDSKEKLAENKRRRDDLEWRKQLKDIEKEVELC